MKMSQAFGSTLHTAPGRSESEGHQMLLRAAMVRQVGQGIFAYLPFGWRSVRKIEAILRSEMERIGGQEVSMPVVQPAELWKETGRYSKIGPELVRLTDRHDRDMVLAMTHEEVVTFLGRSEIGSYRQLPRMVYQLQTKFRDDARPRAGLIRVREFIMKDAYSFAADEAGLDEQYRDQYRAYHAVFRRCGVPVRAVLSDVGVMGGSMAHEFMYLTPIGEDTLLLCDGCGFAANLDVVAAPGDGCPGCGGELRATRGVEAGNIFKLGTRYSGDLGAAFVDRAGERRPLVMGCYGIGVGRLVGCAAEEHRDDKGLRLPVTIAPYHVHLTLLDDLGSPAGQLAQRVYDELWAAGVEVLFDERAERAGVKFADADVIGLPLRITVGRRGFDDGTAELRDRGTAETTVVPLDDVVADVVRRIAAMRAALEKPVPIERPDELR